MVKYCKSVSTRLHLCNVYKINENHLSCPVRSFLAESLISESESTYITLENTENKLFLHGFKFLNIQVFHF